MDIVEILKQDYQRFPANQTYSIYDLDVYFKDPLNEFRGLERYKQTIALISNLFQEIQLDLHDISRTENIIKTEWTLNMTSPLPWKPRLAIPGRSELELSKDELIVSHIDYWNCSRFDVLKQNFFPSSKTQTE
jgi:Uncharacterized conserved protein (DUF2358)